MVWVIVVVAVVVLALAAWVGTGRWGEMPGVVNDRPKAHIPDGPVDEDFLAEVRFPRASTGYDRGQVDAYLRSFVDDAATAELLETAFDIVAGGYDMQAVDAVLDRMARDAAPTQPEPEPEVEPEVLTDAEVVAEDPQEVLVEPAPERAAEA